MSKQTDAMRSVVQSLLADKESDFSFEGDGEIKVDEMVALFTHAVNEVQAERLADFETVHAEFTALLEANPKLRTIPLGDAVNEIWMTRVEAKTAGANMGERAANRARLEAVLPEYVRSQENLFYGQGRGGIVVHYVHGETDADGNQAFRTSNEDWAKIEGRKEKKAAKIAANGQAQATA